MLYSFLDYVLMFYVKNLRDLGNLKKEKKKKAVKMNQTKTKRIQLKYKNLR